MRTVDQTARAEAAQSRPRGIAENALAGVGLGAALLGGGLLWATVPPLFDGMTLAEWGKVAGSAAVTYFGALATVRYSADEWRDSVERAKLRQYATWATAKIDELRERIADLEDRADAVAVLDAQSIAADRQASSVQHNVEKARRVQRNAETMLRELYRSGDITRKRMAQQGVGQRDWERARRLLVKAGVLDEAGDVLITNPRSAAAAVESTVESALELAEGTSFEIAWTL